MTTYSVQYLFRFIPKGLKNLGTMSKAASKASKSVHGLGAGVSKLSKMSTLFSKGGRLATRIMHKMGLASKKTGMDMAALSKHTAASAKSADSLAAAGRRGASSIAMLGRAATAAKAKIAALHGAMRTSPMMMGGYEKSARARGGSASTILAGRKKDAAMATKATKASKAVKAGRGRGANGVVRLGGAAAMTRRIGAGGPGMIAGGIGAYGAHSLLSRYADFEAAEIYVNTIGRRQGNNHWREQAARPRQGV